MKVCHDFPDAPSCCDSCHEDEERGYGMCELRRDDGDGLDAYVCCAVLRHIDSDQGVGQ